MGLKKIYKIKIPAVEGFVGRRCNNIDCNKYFRIKISDLQSEIICPYCGVKGPMKDMWTAEQSKYARKIIIEEVKQELTELLLKSFHKLSTSTRNNIYVKFKVNESTYIKKQVTQPVEYQIDSQIECSECQSEFQVNGIFGFCPICKYENINIYDANLEIIKAEINTSNDRERALRHAYGDLVSTFEGFCKKYSSTVTNTNFQNLKDTRKYFKKSNNSDIFYGLSSLDKTNIKRVFMKRHVYVHPDGTKGIINAQFIREVPEDKQLLGQQAQLSTDELEKGANILRRIITNLIGTKNSMGVEIN